MGPGSFSLNGVTDNRCVVEKKYAVWFHDISLARAIISVSVIFRVALPEQFRAEIEGDLMKVCN